MSRKITIGKIARAHGMKGEVKVLPYPLLNAEILPQIPRFYLKTSHNEYKPLEPESVRQAPGEGFLFKFKEIKDRDAAEALHDKVLYVEVEDLPPREEDEYYVFELVGLKALLPDGKELGMVKGLMPVGPYELLEIKTPERKTIYIPMIHEIIKEINLEKGILYLDPPEDLLEIQGYEVKSNAN
ncbi:ribosome maturation factor RimM [Thermodesulfatator atlanticus]